MASIQWRDSYSVGNDQMDNQHKQLVELVNDLFKVILDKEIEISLSYEVDKLIEYTQEHFKNEETLLEKAGYDFLDQHKATHEKLVKDVIVFKEQIEKGTEGVSSELYTFLRAWLLNHILDEDMQYKYCLSIAAENGLLAE